MIELRAEAVRVVRGARTILEGVSLDLGRSGLIAIVGPNGAGKSTLLKCLAGVIPVDGGQVFLGERPLENWSGVERAKQLGYLPQHFEPHWDFTGAEILTLGAARSGLPTPDLPDLAPLLDARWSTLSGGERARVLFAAIEAGRPSILLADEPAASLDVARQIEALTRLRAHAQAGLAIVVLHDLNMALRCADRVIVLDRSGVRLDGPPVGVASSFELDAIFNCEFVREKLESGIWLRPKHL